MIEMFRDFQNTFTKGRLLSTTGEETPRNNKAAFALARESGFYEGGQLATTPRLELCQPRRERGFH
jgi:hypothetical protein